MLVATFPRQAHDWLGHEVDPGLYRRAGKIKSNLGKLETGTVLGQTSIGAATSAVKSSGANTGNGVLTVDATTPVLAGAAVGVWTVRCIAAAANGGTFRVEDPKGLVRGDVAVGATFADGIKFAIADGSADFVVGDGFDITVAAGSELYVPLAPAATDGSQIASAIVINTVTTAAAIGETAVLVGHAQIIPNRLVWPANITTAQRAKAIAELADRHIVSFQR